MKALHSRHINTSKQIVVNDAGVDVSGIIDAFQGLLTIKYIVHDVNKDRAAARNTAIRHASGQYIAYLDDDDIFYITNITPILCIVHNKDCFDKVGMFDESFTVLEDWDLWIRMAEKGVKCILFKYRMAQNTKTSNISPIFIYP